MIIQAIMAPRQHNVVDGACSHPQTWRVKVMSAAGGNGVNTRCCKIFSMATPAHWQTKGNLEVKGEVPSQLSRADQGGR